MYDDELPSLTEISLKVCTLSCVIPLSSDRFPPYHSMIFHWNRDNFQIAILHGMYCT